MEEMFVYLLGAGVVLLSPLVPGLRPLVKTVVKGGLVAADTTRGLAHHIGQTWHDVVAQANEEYQAGNRSGPMGSTRSNVVIEADARVIEPESPAVKPVMHTAAGAQANAEAVAETSPAI
jgi:hypothetical protein